MFDFFCCPPTSPHSFPLFLLFYLLSIPSFYCQLKVNTTILQSQESLLICNLWQFYLLFLKPWPHWVSVNKSTEDSLWWHQVQYHMETVSYQTGQWGKNLCNSCIYAFLSFSMSISVFQWFSILINFESSQIHFSKYYSSFLILAFQLLCLFYYFLVF